MFKIERRDGLEVYAGDTGFVVLKQDNSLGDDDSYVFIHPEDIPAVIKYLEQSRKTAYEIRTEIAAEKSAA